MKCFPFCRRSAWSWCAAARWCRKHRARPKTRGLIACCNTSIICPEHVILLFFCRGKADRTKKVTARIEGLGGRVDFATAGCKGYANIWLNRQLKAYNKTMSRQAAEKFLSPRRSPAHTHLAGAAKGALLCGRPHGRSRKPTSSAVTSPTIVRSSLHDV